MQRRNKHLLAEKWQHLPNTPLFDTAIFAYFKNEQINKQTTVERPLQKNKINK